MKVLLQKVRVERGIMINATVEDARLAGATEADIADAVAAHRRDEIKAECGRRIFAVASAPTQQNMAAAVAVIAAKTAATRSDPEKAVLAAFEASLGWVQAMRAAVATNAADPAIDFRADAAWPACPEAVMALASNF